METLLNLEDYTIAADEAGNTENHATVRADWQGWAIGDRFQIPRKIKKFSKLFGIWTVTDLWQSGKNAMLTISDGLRTLNQPVKELDVSWKIDDAPVVSPVLESVEMEPELESAAPAVEESTSVAVEVVQADLSSTGDELSYDEERDRLHLERKVERAFYEAGRALRELRDRRLYRSTHKTFESYCRDRFGFQRAHSYRLIEAAQVVENLVCLPEENPENNQMSPNGRQNPSEETLTTDGRQNPAGDDLGTNGRHLGLSPIGAQILPTNERQVRSLVRLEPEQQRLVWQQAVEDAGGKVPSSRVVKDIVERMTSPKENESESSLKVAHHLTLNEGGLVEIYCPDNKKIHARLGRIAKVREKTVEVWLRDTEAMLMVKHTLKHSSVEAVPLEREPSCLAVARRIDALRERGLDPFELEVLGLLERSVVLTPVELGYLEAILLRSRCAIEGRC